MAPQSREPAPSSGLLASAFSYVAREAKSFITAATGGEVQQEQPEASSSRIMLDGKRRRVRGGGKEKERERRAKRVRKRSEVGSDRARARRRLQEEGEGEYTAKLVKKKVPPQPAQREKERLSEPEGADDEDDELSELPVRPLPRSLKKRRGQQAKNAQRDAPAKEVGEPEPQPRVKKMDRVAADPSKLMPPPPIPIPPPPTPLTARSATPFPTMPGSLFPRSTSLMPETPANLRRGIPRPSTPPPPPATDEVPAEAVADPRSEVSPSRGRSFDRKGRSEKRDESSAGLPTVRESSRQSDTSGKVRSCSRNSVEEPLSEPTTRHLPSKGKERACDTSGEIRVREMERELDEAREAHARNAHGRGDIVREREKDQQIRMLQQEVARLRAELALKNGVASSAGLMPPPPPPPPPLVRIMVPTGPSETGDYLASARASLKPTAPPVEAPINGAAYGSARVQKTGQPTMNMSSDKIAAFLREMKNVRLRKVGGPIGAMGPPVFPPSAAGDVAGELIRSTSNSRMSDARRAAIMGDSSFDTGVAARIFIGEKRKRDAAEEAVAAGPSKRREKSFVRSNTTGGSSTVSNTQTGSSSQSSESNSQRASSSSQTSGSGASLFDIPAPSRPRTSNGTQLRIWPTRSTETDVTTPSLCSDNENDHSEDKPPETPSDSGRGNDAQSVMPQEPRPQPEPEIIDVDALETPPKPQKRSPTPGQAAVVDAGTRKDKDAFARRAPGNPMPMKTPTKPKPPARGKTKIPIPVLAKMPLSRRVLVGEPTDGGESESDDPLLMVRSRHENRRRSLEDRVKADAPVAGPSRTSRDASSVRSRSQSHGQAAAEAEPAETRMSNHARRRLTLDEELRRAGDSLWQEEDEEALPPSEPEEDLDSGQLVALGRRSSKSGFLARGGGAGSPVFFGEGYVQGSVADDLSTNGRSGRVGGARR